MPKQTPLVNQNPAEAHGASSRMSDDIPFANEQNGDSTAPAAAQVPDYRPQDAIADVANEKITQLNARILELEGDNASAEDEILKLKQEVEQYKADPGDTGEPNIKLLCFLAILQGQAAKGELSIGAVKGDEAVRLQMKHAAGMASFAEVAAKKL